MGHRIAESIDLLNCGRDVLWNPIHVLEKRQLLYEIQPLKDVVIETAESLGFPKRNHAPTGEEVFANPCRYQVVNEGILTDDLASDQLSLYHFQYRGSGRRFAVENVPVIYPDCLRDCVQLFPKFPLLFRQVGRHRDGILAWSPYSCFSLRAGLNHQAGKL